MLDKTVPSLADAVSGIVDGATLMIGGFGGSGIPTDLIRALLGQGASDLTIVNNNAGNGPLGLSELIAVAYVNLGIGMPTTIAQHLPKDREIILHSENGIVGMTNVPQDGRHDPDIINAGKEFMG